MLTARIDGDNLITEGQVNEGEHYPGLCCGGFGTEVIWISEFSDDPTDITIYAACDNPACRHRHPGDAIAIYGWQFDDFAERLAGMSEMAEHWPDTGGTLEADDATA